MDIPTFNGDLKKWACWLSEKSISEWQTFIEWNGEGTDGACGLELSGQLPTNLLEETQHHDIEEDNEDNDDEIDSLLCREEAMPEVSVSLSQ